MFTVRISAGEKEICGIFTAAFVFGWPILSMIISLFRYLDKPSNWPSCVSRALNV